jgi:hypothetical protein
LPLTRHRLPLPPRNEAVPPPLCCATRHFASLHHRHHHAPPSLGQPMAEGRLGQSAGGHVVMTHCSKDFSNSIRRKLWIHLLAHSGFFICWPLSGPTFFLLLISVSCHLYQLLAAIVLFFFDVTKHIFRSKKMLCLQFSNNEHTC